MPDVISVTGVSATGHHGVLPEERRDGQIFVVDLALSVDIGPAAAADDLARTVDYSAVAAQVVQVIEGPAVDLIETLAERIAATSLAFDGVLGVRVTVHKPEAPVGVPFSDVAVTVHRGSVPPV